MNKTPPNLATDFWTESVIVVSKLVQPNIRTSKKHRWKDKGLKWKGGRHFEGSRTFAGAPFALGVFVEEWG